MVVSRLLTPAEYGIVAMVAVAYLLVARFSNPGYTEMVIREADSEKYRGEVLWVFIVHGLLLALILAVLAFPLSWFFREPKLVAPALVYAVILFLYALPGASESYLLKKKEFSKVFKVELWGGIIGISLTIILAYFGYSYWSLILPHLLIPLFYFFIYQHYQPISWRSSTMTTFKALVAKMRSVAWPLSKVSLLEYWEEQTDNFWIGRLQGSAVLGVYNRAFLVAHLPKALFKPLINSVVLPQWQQYDARKEQIHEAYGFLLIIILSLMSVPMALVLWFPLEISVALWGKQWAGVAPFLGVLGLVMGFQVVCSTCRVMFILSRQERLLVRYSWTQGLIMIVVVTVAAFISMKVLVLALVLTVLVIKVPAFAYWCLHRALGYPGTRILRLLGLPWILTIVIWVLLVADHSMLMPVPLAILFAWSGYHLYQKRGIFSSNG